MKFIRNWEEWEDVRKSTDESIHNEKLELCPLCGRKVSVHFKCIGDFYPSGSSSAHIVYLVFCSECGLNGSSRFTPYHAVNKWNRLAKLIRSRIEKSD